MTTRSDSPPDYLNPAVSDEEKRTMDLRKAIEILMEYVDAWVEEQDEPNQMLNSKHDSDNEDCMCEHCLAYQAAARYVEFYRSIIINIEL